MERRESSNSFLSPSGVWAGAQCRTADQKQSVCSLTSLHPSAVREAKVTEQRGCFICHPSPATKPLANTLVFNLSSPVVRHQCLSSQRSLKHSWGCVQAAERGGDVPVRKPLAPRLGPHSLGLLPYLEHRILTHSFEGLSGRDGKAAATPMSGNCWFSKHLPLSSPLVSILPRSTNKECFDYLDDSTGICLFKSTGYIYTT